MSQPASLRRVHVHHPAHTGRLVLRGAPEWHEDLQPVAAPCAGPTEFLLPVVGPYRRFKPVLLLEDGPRWAEGEDLLAVAGDPRPLVVYPHFEAQSSRVEVAEIPDGVWGGVRRLHVHLPAGYGQNALERVPVVYMHDGQNLFDPSQSLSQADWRAGETLDLLDRMSRLRRAIVVGIEPKARMEEYAAPGYEAYGRHLVEEVKPWVDEHYRTLTGRAHTSVMGSSLGGVASFHVAWRHPDVFGQAACLSSTFGWRDDLFERVARDPRPPIRLYLDTGWPNDNYEVTRNMRELLVARGWEEGRDLVYLAHPLARHDERAWAERLHIPLQFLLDGPARETPVQEAHQNGHRGRTGGLGRSLLAASHSPDQRSRRRQSWTSGRRRTRSR